MKLTKYLKKGMAAVSYTHLDVYKRQVVYQGVPGAYSYAAMINFFGKDVDNFNVPTWRECMDCLLYTSMCMSTKANMPKQNRS